MQALRYVTRSHDAGINTDTVHSIGQMMATLVVQECHLWLNLADMMKTDKYQFLDPYPMSAYMAKRSTVLGLYRSRRR